MHKLNGLVVYLWFTIRFAQKISSKFALHPCIQHAEDGKRQQLERLLINLVKLDDDRFMRHKNHFDTSSGWRDR